MPMTREDDLEFALRRALHALHKANETILESKAVTDTIWMPEGRDGLIGTPLYDFIASEIRECRKALK